MDEVPLEVRDHRPRMSTRSRSSLTVSSVGATPRHRPPAANRSVGQTAIRRDGFVSDFRSGRTTLGARGGRGGSKPPFMTSARSHAQNRPSRSELRHELFLRRDVRRRGPREASLPGCLRAALRRLSRGGVRGAAASGRCCVREPRHRFHRVRQEDALERIFPFDLIPRVIPERLGALERGLTSASGPSTLLHDVYHEQRSSSDRVDSARARLRCSSLPARNDRASIRRAASTRTSSGSTDPRRARRVPRARGQPSLAVGGELHAREPRRR